MKNRILVLASFLSLTACATTNRGPAADHASDPCPLSDFVLLESAPNTNVAAQHNQALNARNLCLASQTGTH